MARLSRHSYAASVIVATVVIGGQNLLLQYNDTLRSYLPKDWVGLLLSAGIAGVVFKLALQVYERGAWKLLNRDLVISGKWKHRLRPSAGERNLDRDGEFTVLQTAFDIKVVAGKNFDATTGAPTYWHSLAVFDERIEDRSLWLIYEVNRTNPDPARSESEIDRGLIHLQLHPDPKSGKISRMAGQYWDAGRSTRRGEFEAEKLAD